MTEHAMPWLVESWNQNRRRWYFVAAYDREDQAVSFRNYLQRAARNRFDQYRVRNRCGAAS